MRISDNYFLSVKIPIRLFCSNLKEIEKKFSRLGIYKNCMSSNQSIRHENEFSINGLFV